MEWDKLKRARGVCCTSRQADRVARLLPQLKGKPAGLVPPRKLNSLVEQERRQELRAIGSTCTMPPNIHHCDFRELLPRGIVQPGSAGLVLTDPPWGKKFLPLWADLALFAAQVLCGDGLLVAFLGTNDIPKKLNALDARLEFVRLVSLLFDKGKTTHFYHGRVHVFNHCTFVAVFAKSAARQQDAHIGNVVAGTGRAKTFHEWQQDLGIAQKLIADLTTPADLIVDPFGGSFTFAVAAKRAGRLCISCDVDEKACEIGAFRLNMDLMPKDQQSTESEQAVPPTSETTSESGPTAPDHAEVETAHCRSSAPVEEHCQADQGAGAPPNVDDAEFEVTGTVTGKVIAPRLTLCQVVSSLDNGDAVIVVNEPLNVVGDGKTIGRFKVASLVMGAD